MSSAISDGALPNTCGGIYTSQGPFCTYCSTVVWNYFTLNRSREGPKEFLKDYAQLLLADAYGSYNGAVAGNAITRAGFRSHARRKFVDAEKAATEIAREAVTRIGTLFALERQAKDVSVAEGKRSIAAG